MKVFLSSTAQDLTAHRKVAEDVVLQLSQQIVAMEHFSALPGTPVEECERLARESDVVVCIVAHRYGSGITQREVEAAHKAGKDVLVWIVADDHPWSEKKEENQLADPNVFGDPAKVDEVRQRVEALFNFKAWLRKTFTADKFTTPDDLGRKIAVALTNYVKGRAAPPVPQDRISIARLPVTGSELFGREAELQILDDAWANPNTNIVSFVAWGGVGKTALVNHWLKRRMARDNYRGADRVLGWSFFSQGSSERAASADLFIDWALRWFDDADPTSGSPWDKGERLARYIRQSRTLLILDGLEPLQHLPGPHEGRLKDAALQALLVELAAQQPGLCVISTRETVGDLIDFEKGTVVQHDLEHLSPQAGAQILRSLNVKGDDEELEQAARELDGHAFSITLLGSYLQEILDGDVRRRKEIQTLLDDSRYGDAGERMIAAYEIWLGEGMELAILRLLGLFDRPADLSSLIALREPPAIKGLTEPLQHFKSREWNQAVAKLRRIQLVSRVSPEEVGSLDTHPLVREYFKLRMKEDRPQTWSKANYRLYEHLKKSSKEFPNTPEEMFPLYSAAIHGCSAGRHMEVLESILRRRIWRGDEAFSTKNLGMFGSDLALLSTFFEMPWGQLVSGVPEDTKGFLLAIAGFDLLVIGRLEEAGRLIRASLDHAITSGNYRNASIGAFNLSEVYLMKGDLTQALEVAKTSVKFADLAESDEVRTISNAILASIYHQLGQMEDAAKTFVKSEMFQQSWRPQLKFLVSVWGFRYCDFLIDRGKLDEASERAVIVSEIDKQTGDLLSIALDNLSLARIEFLRSRQHNERQAVLASSLVQKALEGLRRAGSLDFIALGLLCRSEINRSNGDYRECERDLTEVMRITMHNGMIMLLVDYHLESARLRVAQSSKDKAREHFATAKEMIDRMGYHRRDKEVAELEAQLA